MKKSYIWPLVNRFSHLFLIITLGVSYTFGNYADYLNLHIQFGMALGVAFIFRILWGVIGPKYSRFRDFNFSISDLKDYMLGTLDYFLSIGKKSKEYVGHNPASSFAIVVMMILTCLAIITGLLALGIENNHGVFSFINSPVMKEMEIFSGLHSLLANALMLVVGAHVAGSLIDKYIKKSDAIDSMISGYKKTQELLSVKLNMFQILFAFIWVAGSLFTLYYMIFTKDNIFLTSANVKQDYAAMHQDFATECADCHMLYPPYYLPKKSWGSMMSSLSNHFGEDASLDDATTKSIATFLQNNSSETSNERFAYKMTKDLKNKPDILSVTKSRYWSHKHSHIDAAVFKSEHVKYKANCVACHKDADKGLLDYDLIKVPKA